MKTSVALSVFFVILTTLTAAKHSTSGSSRASDKGETDDKDKNGFYDFESLYVDRNFNSSFAINIPLFTVTIPGYGRHSPSDTYLSSINLGNIALLGIVSVGALSLFYPLLLSPLGLRSFGRSFKAFQSNYESVFLSNALSGVSEYVMKMVERSLEGLPSLPRLEAQECLKRSICEANNQPKKYGMTGFLIQLMFPPYIEADDPMKVVSKYQLAARYGRQEKSECAVQYDGCIINFLDVILMIVNFFIR